jgi:hypothetical protein
MSKTRVEAFSDAVMAILITIMDTTTRPRHRAHQRQDPCGRTCTAVLALARAVRDRMDGEPLRRDADRLLRGVLLAAAIAYLLLQSTIIADQAQARIWNGVLGDPRDRRPPSTRCAFAAVMALSAATDQARLWRRGVEGFLAR